MTSHPKPRIIFIQDLCNELPEEQMREAEQTFWSYLEIVKRIADREQSQTASDDVHSPDWTNSHSESLIQSMRD